MGQALARQFQSPFDTIEPLAESVDVELLGCIGRSEMGQVLHQHDLTALNIGHPDGQIADLAFNTVERHLEGFEMLQD